METGEKFNLSSAAQPQIPLIWGHVVGRPEYVDGKCVKVRGNFQDITEQKNGKNQNQAP